MPEFEFLNYDDLDALGGGPLESMIQDYYNDPEHLRADGTELEARALTDERLAVMDAEFDGEYEQLRLLLDEDVLAQMQGEAKAVAEWMDRYDPGDHRYDGPED